MLITKKQKKVLGISLIVALVVVIAVAMTIGIYFLVKAGKNDSLTKEQIRFGEAFEQLYEKPVDEVVDTSSLPSDIDLSTITYCDQNYVFYKADENKSLVYDLTNKKAVLVEFDFDNVEAVDNNLAILASNSSRKLVDLRDGKVVGDLKNASIVFSNGFALVKTTKGGVASYLGETKSEETCAYVLNTTTLECVYDVSLNSDVLDLSLSENFLFATFASKTEIYSLSDFKLLKTYENLSGTGSFNLVSPLTEQQFCLKDYMLATELNAQTILLERMVQTSDETYFIALNDVLGSPVKYNAEYFIYDVKNNVQLALDNEGYVLSSLETGLNDYIALIYTSLKDHKISDADKIVKYFEITYNKGTRLKEVVSYNYSRNGKIVGFSGKTLLVDGGRSSGEINFDGANTELLSSSNDEKIIGSNGVYVSSSIIGQKRLYNLEGGLVVNNVFMRVSPVNNGQVIAFDGEKYYVVDINKGEATELNVEEGTLDYTFMGIGLYFVKGKTGVDVIKLGGDKLYSDTSVRFSLYGNRTVLLTIQDGEKTILHKIRAQREFAKWKSDETVEPVRNITSKKANPETKNFVESPNELPVTAEPVVDSVSGVGKMAFGFSLNVSDIQFLTYAQLSDEMKALIPSFDSDMSYTDSSTGKTYNFLGAYFLVNKNIATGILKLSSDGANCYAIVVALKDMYISQVNASTVLGGVETNMRNCAYTLPIDKHENVLAPQEQNYLVFSEGDDGNDTQRYMQVSSTAYDGGMTFSAGDADTINFNIEVRNSFYARGLNSDYFEINVTDQIYTGGYFYFAFNTNYNATTKELTIEAGGGRVITGFDLVYADKSNSLLDEYTEVQTIKYDVITTKYTIKLDETKRFAGIRNVSVSELYNVIRLENFDNSFINNLYYFYGYGLNSNPAPMGFENFYRREKISTPTRTGYDFAGYNYGEENSLMIDSKGSWVGEAELVKTSTGIDTFTFVAGYTPKTYQIYYDSFNNVLPEHTDVTFGQPVGELRKIEEPGYDFGGWFTSPNGEGIEYTSATVYDVARSITLYAKWTPKQYTINFHSNIDAYSNKTVRGFSYNIGKVVLTSAFGSLQAESDFTVATKTVTFNETYGEMPSLVGYSSVSGKETERYKFVGWYDHSDFTVLGDNSIERGTLFTNQTRVSATPVVDLYAHFEREVYSANVAVIGNGNAYAGGDVMPIIADLTYDGSTSSGRAINKGVNKSGDELWTKAGEAYVAYQLQNEELSMALKVNVGYYVKQIRISLYPLGSTPAVYTLNFNYNPRTNVVSQDGSLTNDFVSVSFDDAYSVVLHKLNKESSDSKVADVEFVVEAKAFESQFVVSGNATFDISSNLSNSYVLRDNVYTFSNVNYGTNAKFNFLMKGENNLSSSLLKAIVVGEERVEFALAYQKIEGVNRYILTSTKEHETNTENGKLTQTYTFVDGEDEIKLILTSDFANNETTYELTLSQTANHTINLELENYSSNVSLTAHAVGETSSDGLNIQTTKNGASAGSNALSVTPNDEASFEINAKDGNFIYALTIHIGETDFSLFKFVGNFDGTLKFVATSIATTEYFASSMGEITLLGSNVKISFDEETQTIKITIGNLKHDVSFDVYYLSSTVISLVGPVSDEQYSLKVTEGETSVLNSDLVDLREELTDSTSFLPSKIYYKNGAYLISGYNDSIKKVVFSAKDGAEKDYKVSSVTAQPNSDLVVVSPTLNAATIDTQATFVEINFELVHGEVTKVTSYVGVGGNNYQTDPLEEFGLQSKIFIDYHAQDYTLSQYEFDGSSAGFAFYGGEFSVKVYAVDGYYYTDSNLTETSGKKLTPVVSAGEDEKGKYTLLTFTLSDFTMTIFELNIYQKAIEYDIHYDPSNDATHVAEGSMENTHHVYNVPSELSGGGYTRPRYTLIGFSKEEVSGIDLDERNVDYSLSEILVDNLTTKDNDVVTLYLVFKANEYHIRYNLNDANYGNGSSTAVLRSGANSIKYDHVFSTLAVGSRQGYSFNGWFTSTGDDGVQVSQGDTLGEELFDKLEVDELNITLYAHWTKYTYTVILHYNDARDEDGFGSSTAEREKTQYAVEYDTPFERFDPISRVGYDFLGFKAVRLNPDNAASNELGFFGYGADCALVLDNNAERLGITINDSARVIDIYAVWVSQIFKGYVYLNNEGLGTYGQEDGRFVITYDGRESRSSVAFTDVYIEVAFDKALNVLPSVTPVGYNFEGFWVEKTSALESATHKLEADSVLNLELFNQLFYTSNVSTTDKLSTLYESGARNFSLYAHYSTKEFSVSLNSNLDHHFEKVENVNSYDYTLVKSPDVAASIQGTYLSSFVLDLLMPSGLYASQIDIKYNDELGALHVLTITFSFVNDGSLVMAAVEAGVENNTTTNEFIKLLDSTLYVANGVFIKVLPYNKKGADLNNIVRDASRLILGFDSVKTDFVVDVQTGVQMFDVSYYRFVTGYESHEDFKVPQQYIETRQFQYGTVITEGFLNDYAYTQYFQFIRYYYGAFENEELLDPRVNPNRQVELNDTITENTIVVGLYELIQRQAVNFYFYNASTKKYELRAETNKYYVLTYYDEATGAFVNGEYDGVHYALTGERAGRLLTLPSLSQEAWPTGTYLVGFIIADEAPLDNGFYSYSLGNCGSHEVFDTNVIIDGEINVYAVYNTPKFNLEMRDNETGVEAKADYELYHVDKSGSITPYDPSEIYLVSLTEEQMEIVRSVMGDENQKIAEALGEALKHDLSGLRAFSSREFEDIGDLKSGNYFFLITVKYNSEGVPYIAEVSVNYYKYDGVTLTSRTY